MPKAIAYLAVITAAFLLLIPGAGSTTPPSIRFAVDRVSFLDPEYLAIDVMADSTETFNAVQIAIAYPPEVLAVSGIELDPAVCSPLGLVGSQTPDGQTGLVCATADRLSGEFKIARIYFRKITPGWADFRLLDDSLLLAADGRGTPIDFLPEYHRVEVVK